MKREIIILTASVLTLVFGCALEELLPKFAGVGFPVLLMSSIYLASKRNMAASLMFAVAAGAAEDSLCALPFATSAAFFAVSAVFVQFTELKWSTFACAFPAYQLWLGMCIESQNGSIFGRFLTSIPVGLVTAGFVWCILGWVELKGAMDEK